MPESGDKPAALTVEELTAKVNALAEKVKKQAQLLTSTGQQVLDLQLHSTKSKFADLPNPQDVLKEAGLAPIPRDEDARVQPPRQHQPRQTQPQEYDVIDSEADYATNEDIMQLVGELQGQLELLEERSIRRSINLTLSSDEARLAPLPDTDGSEPSKDTFPQTLGEFKKLSNSRILELCSFYQLLPPTEQDNQQISDFLTDKIQQLNFDNSTAKTSDYSEAELDEFHDKLARYLGIQHRRVAGAW